MIDVLDLIYQIHILYSRSGDLNTLGGGISFCASLTVLMKTDKIC